MKTLRLTLQGNFAHYKRLEGASVKQTHTIPTRTSIFGLIGAILGKPRDSYYKEFGDKFTISIVPQNIRRYSIPQLELSTSSTPFIDKTSIKSPDHRKDRQRTSLEYLVNPEFDIYIRSEDFPTELINRLENQEYYYSPYMGTTECLADIRHHGFVELQPITETQVDSVVPETQVKSVVTSEKSKLTFERMTSNFTTDSEGRSAEGYIPVVVNLNMNQPTEINPDAETQVYNHPDTDRNLMFF